MSMTRNRYIPRLLAFLLCVAPIGLTAYSQTHEQPGAAPSLPPGPGGNPPPGPPPGAPPGVPAGTPAPDGIGVTVGPAPSAENIDESGFGPWEDISVVKPLQAGEKIPDGIVLHDRNGTPFNLSAAVAEQPTLLIFYRGGWCPYCNVHLGELGTISEDLQEIGYRILAISSDTPAQLLESSADQTFEYQLLSDGTLEAAAQFGLRYKVVDRYLEHVKNDRGRDLVAQNGGYLLTPGAFLVDQSGTIRYTYVNNNFAVRITPQNLLKAARSIDAVDKR